MCRSGRVAVVLNVTDSACGNLKADLLIESLAIKLLRLHIWLRNGLGFDIRVTHQVLNCRSFAGEFASGHFILLKSSESLHI